MLYLHGFILRFIFSFVVSTFRQVTYYVSSTCSKRFKYNFINNSSLCIFGYYISLIKGSDEKLFLIISKEKQLYCYFLYIVNFFSNKTSLTRLIVIRKYWNSIQSVLFGVFRITSITISRRYYSFMISKIIYMLKWKSNYTKNMPYT